MDLTEHRFDDLSDIQYRIYTCDISAKRRATAMVLAFSGTFGVGSAGNNDGVFMRMVTYSALSVWRSHAVVFDLRELTYTWGDKIAETFGCGVDPSGVEDLPYATVISGRCRQGFSTCMSLVEPAFDDVESALDNLRPRAQAALDKLWADADAAGG